MIDGTVTEAHIYGENGCMGQFSLLCICAASSISSASSTSPLLTMQPVLSPLLTMQPVLSPLLTVQPVLSPLLTVQPVLSPLLTVQPVLSPL